MNIYIEREYLDTFTELESVLQLIKLQENIKIYIIGELGYDLELVLRFKLQGLIARNSTD